MEIADAQQLWAPQPGWLNTASYGLPPRPAFDALQEVLADWRAGATSWEPWGESTELARASFARLVGVPVADVFQGSTVSAAMALVASALPDRARVLVPDVEFTSNVFPWQVHADRGIEVVTAPVDGFAEAIADGYDVVSFSAVQSSTGVVADVPGLCAAARATGALVVVDGSQAVGWLPVDATVADVLVAATYKWMMSPRGATFGYLAPAVRDRIRPAYAGWFAGADTHGSYYGLPMELAADARRFDQSPAWFSHVGTAPALAVIEQLGVEAINDYDVTLANQFRTGIGLAPSNSAIVSADIPGAEQAFAEAGIRAAVRDGRIRVSFHVYSTPEDVRTAVEALAGLIER